MFGAVSKHTKQSLNVTCSVRWSVEVWAFFHCADAALTSWVLWFRYGWVCSFLLSSSQMESGTAWKHRFLNVYFTCLTCSHWRIIRWNIGRQSCRLRPRRDTHNLVSRRSVQLPALFFFFSVVLVFLFLLGGFPQQILYNTEPLLCYNVETGRHLRTAGYMTLDWCFIVFLTDSLMTGDSLISRWSHRADKIFSFSRAEGDCTLTRSLFILLLPFKNDQRHI